MRQLRLVISVNIYKVSGQLKHIDACDTVGVSVRNDNDDAGESGQIPGDMWRQDGVFRWETRVKDAHDAR